MVERRIVREVGHHGIDVHLIEGVSDGIQQYEGELRAAAMR